jgi:flagellar biosynthesis component FlhA
VLAKFIRYSAVEVSVLSYTEIPDDKQVTIEASIGA